MLEAGAAGRARRPAPTAPLVVLYPEDNKKIVPGKYTDSYLHAQIAARGEGYLAVEGYGAAAARFFRAWEEVLPRIAVAFVTWEEVVDAIGDAALGAFYGLCRRFNWTG